MASLAGPLVIHIQVPVEELDHTRLVEAHRRAAVQAADILLGLEVLGVGDGHSRVGANGHRSHAAAAALHTAPGLEVVHSLVLGVGSLAREVAPDRNILGSLVVAGNSLAVGMDVLNEELEIESLY